MTACKKERTAGWIGRGAVCRLEQASIDVQVVEILTFPFQGLLGRHDPGRLSRERHLCRHSCRSPPFPGSALLLCRHLPARPLCRPSPRCTHHHVRLRSYRLAVCHRLSRWRREGLGRSSRALHPRLQRSRRSHLGIVLRHSLRLWSVSASGHGLGRLSHPSLGSRYEEVAPCSRWTLERCSRPRCNS